VVLVAENRRILDFGFNNLKSKRRSKTHSGCTAYWQFIYTGMLNIKRKYFIWLMFLLVGVGYFSAMSNLELNYFLKSLIAVMPIQIAAIIYVTYRRWNHS
jgi:hypothetical protein